jgi:murein L,D-transpeptidase YcbB/YkuD
MRLDRHIRWAARLTLFLLAALATPVAAQQAKKQAEQPPLRLLLNVPENRLYVYENGVRTHKFRIAVGLPGYETPAGNYSIRQVIWNPWWHPPDSDWARGRKAEAPGTATNPMGRVKLNFSELLYIHGTPERQSLGRATSRGCVRMANEDVIQLTRLVHKYASPSVTEDRIARLEENRTATQTIPLSSAVPFKVVYSVAAITEGFLHLYPDLYGLVGEDYEDQVWSVLEDAGIDRSDVDREKFDRLLSKGPKKKVAMSIDTLTTVGATVSSTNHR